jgi:hypothetical protein
VHEAWGPLARFLLALVVRPMLCVLVDGTLSLEKLAAWMGAESALYKFSEREATELQHHLVLHRPDDKYHPAYSACPDSEEWWAVMVSI